MPDQWPRALLRAELTELGYDAVGVLDLEHALRYPRSEPGRGPVGLIIVEQSMLVGDAFDRLRQRHGGPPVILLAGGAGPEPPGPWDRVLRRPISIGEIAEAVRSLVLQPRAAQEHE